VRERSTKELRTEVIEDDGVAVPLTIPRQKGETQLAIKETTLKGRRYVLCRNEGGSQEGCRATGGHPRRPRAQAHPGRQGGGQQQRPSAFRQDDRIRQLLDRLRQGRGGREVRWSIRAAVSGLFAAERDMGPTLLAKTPATDS
jgi:hypothetical protein